MNKVDPAKENVAHTELINSLATSLEVCRIIVKLKDSLYDEVANDGDGCFDTWQSDELEEVISKAEKAIKFVVENMSPKTGIV